MKSVSRTSPQTAPSATAQAVPQTVSTAPTTRTVPQQSSRSGPSWQPPAQSVPQANARPVASWQPSAKTVSQPAVKSVRQAARQSIAAAQAVPEPAAQTVPQLAAQKAPQPAAHKVLQPAAQTFSQPAAQTLPQPAGQSMPRRPRAASTSSEATVLPEDAQGGVEAEVRRIVKHVCPTCSQSFASYEDVRTHWLEKHTAKDKGTQEAASEEAKVETQGSGKQDPFSPPSDAANPFESGVGESEPSAKQTDDTMRAKIVEVDEEGKPVIVRQQDESAPGGVRTIITQEDGSCSAFGEAIVSSLLAQGQTKVMAWISSMDARNLRGLVNELSERFFDIQRHLCDCKAELEEKRRLRGLSMFSLDGDCTEKDLDVAYRRLARTMHPDKNGGTEEAKEQFQTMRASYEELKEQFEQGKIGKAQSSEKDAPPSPESTPEDENDTQNETPKEDPEVPAPDAENTEDGSDTSPNANNAGGTSNKSSGQETIFYCRSEDLSALQGAVCKILEKMKILQQNVAMVERDLAGV